jgi:hypothetical protein
VKKLRELPMLQRQLCIKLEGQCHLKSHPDERCQFTTAGYPTVHSHGSTIHLPSQDRPLIRKAKSASTLLLQHCCVFAGKQSITAGECYMVSRSIR